MSVDTRIGWRDHLLGLFICSAYVAVLMATASDIGMSRDESFYVQAAQDISSWMEQLGTQPKLALERAFIDRAWDYNWEHPPLMKASFALSWLLEKKTGVFGSDSTAFRFPGMLSAGLLLWLIYIWGARLFSRSAGLFAALAFAMLPRPFYHAHLNCFDVPITLMITAVTYCYWRSLTSARWVVILGFVFGLALLTKHNSWVLPGIFLIHFAWVRLFPLRQGSGGQVGGQAPSVWRWPWWLLAMVTIGPLLLFACWPWLWNDTWARFLGYVKFHFHHAYYNITYFGETYFRPPFPVSYPFVMTLFTVPLIAILLSATGLISRWRAFWPFGDREAVVETDSRFTDVLLVGSLLAPLVVIALPASPIFGGTKHWMPAYPFMMLYAGAGFALVTRYTKPILTAALGALFLLPMAVETAHSHPFGLSHYTPIAGGVTGAADKGMNRQFWGFTSGSLIEWLKMEMPKGGRVWVCDTTRGAWNMLQRDGLLPSNISATNNFANADYVLVHHERHFAEVDFQAWVLNESVKPVHVLTYDGVPIISVYKRTSVAQRADETPSLRLLQPRQ